MKRRQAGFELLANFGQLFLGVFRMQLRQHAQHAFENHAMLDRRGIAAVDIRASPDDHFGALPVRLQFHRVGVAGIG